MGLAAHTGQQPAAEPGKAQVATLRDGTIRATCPFCALLCDDVEIARSEAGDVLKPVATVTCPRALTGFGRAVPSFAPQVSGSTVSLAEALDAAADIIKSSRLPLFGGLSTDVDGMRAILALADAAGGVIDHAYSAIAMRNISVLQSRGWIMSTLTEVRNRADLVIVLGNGVGEYFPRFYQRILNPAETMFGPLNRQIVLVGSGDDATLAGPGSSVDVIPTNPADLATFLGALRAELKNTQAPLGSNSTAGSFDQEKITSLAARIKAAAYPVIVWAPAVLPETDGDLIVLSVCDLVRDLTVTQRCAGLSLSGSEGAQTAISVTAWQTGYPLCVSLATGKPIYAPGRFDIANMLARGEGDALIWTASIGTELTPPSTAIPTVVLGTPGLALERTPAVFIPVGTPGLDHRGDLIRCDSVVTQPLKALRNIGLPRVADIAAAISARVANRIAI